MFGRFLPIFARAMVATSLVVASVSVRADDETEKPAPRSPESKQAPEPGSAAAAELKVQEVLQAAMQDRDHLADHVDAISKAADELRQHPDATDKQKENAMGLKMSILFRVASADAERFTPQLQATVEEIKKNTPDSPAAAMGTAYLIIIKDFGGDLPPAEVLAKLEEFQKEYPKSPLGAQLYTYYADQQFAYGDIQQAIDVCEAGLKAYSEDPQAKERLEGSIAELKAKGEMLGKPMAIAGPTLEGTEFNIESLKGKVVLVDFWATWCGPCVAEMPNVQKVYEKLHDKGFEVVGISLDNDESELRDFVKEKDIPWTQIFFKEGAGQGWSNPLAKKYDVQGIPATYVLDRDGRVVAIGARGEMLEKIIAKHLSRATAPLAN